MIKRGFRSLSLHCKNFLKCHKEQGCIPLQDQEAQTVAELPFKPAMNVFHKGKEIQNCLLVYGKEPCGYLFQI